MRKLIIMAIAVIALASQGYSQFKFPAKFRVEKQSMSTPMTELEDIIFVHSYYARPVNVTFDGMNLHMAYDNGELVTKKTVTQFDYESEFEDGKLAFEKYIYTDNANPSDYLLFVVDYSVGYVQVVLTTKNSAGENVGYTSFKRYGVIDDELALN